MQSPAVGPPICDVVPAGRKLTGYGQQHLVTICALTRRPEGETAGKNSPHIDPEREPDRAKLYGSAIRPVRVRRGLQKMIDVGLFGSSFAALMNVPSSRRVGSPENCNPRPCHRISVPWPRRSGKGFCILNVFDARACVAAVGVASSPDGLR